MNCRTCGVQNVEYATTCYSCGKPLGGTFAVSSSAAAPGATSHMPSPHVPTSTGPTVKLPSGVAVGLGRLLFFAVLALLFFREPILQLVKALQSMSSESTPEVVSEPAPPAAPEPTQPPAVVAEAPAPPVAPSAPEEYPAAEAPTEINGFKMTLFEWEQTGPVHFGDVVKGRSQITGFDVSPDNRIDITMRFTFRDPRGRVLEKSDPSRLDQPMESDTLFSSFDYKIPTKGPAGDYDLEIRVDDAVSGRSARFHHTITAAR